ncbi:MAG: transglycosylase SLT domain-containing protein [Acidimicrobiia bacterium]
MRLRRLSFVAGWAAVVLLALAGFAAFGTSGGAGTDPATAAPERVIGHTTGAYAGLTFALLAGDPGQPQSDIDNTQMPELTTATPGAAATASQDSNSPGTMSDASGWLSQVEVRALVSKYFTSRDVNRAVRVAWCESRFDPNSVNLRTGAIGLFQHLPKYWDERSTNAGFPGADPTDAEASTAAAAWEVYHGAGWDIFVCQG